MSGTNITQQETNVNTLEDKPILVCTLQAGYYLLDLNTDEPMRPTDYIPFQGESCYAGPSWGGSPEERCGLEARG